MKPYRGPVPFDVDGNALRVVEGFSPIDWRPADPFHATLALWGDACYSEGWGSGRVLLLRHQQTHVTYPISVATFLWLFPQTSDYPPQPTPSSVNVDIERVLRYADFAPEPPPEGNLLPPYLRHEWWCYSWTGTWAWQRRGKAYGLYLVRRDPYGQNHPGPL